MPQPVDQVGEKTRPGVLERQPSDTLKRKPRKIPAAYLATHRCKVCDGKPCTGHCKF